MVCNYKRRIERIQGADFSTENAEIYVIKTFTKTREKIKLNGIIRSNEIIAVWGN